MSVQTQTGLHGLAHPRKQVHHLSGGDRLSHLGRMPTVQELRCHPRGPTAA